MGGSVDSPTCFAQCFTLGARLTAQMLSSKKALPDQSNTLPSHSNVPLSYGRSQALQDRSDEEPILEELEEWSLIPDRPWVPHSPREIDVNPQDFPPCSGHFPSRHSSPGRNGGCLREGEGHAEVTARW